MPVIVKVQVPLASSEPASDRCLIYAAGRKHTIEQPIPSAAREALAGAPKGYFWAEWTGDAWQLGERAPDQRW